MPSVSKRAREQYYFEMFRKHYSLPAGTIEYGDKPDVILQGPTRIGIEITNFFLEEGTVPTSEQVQKNARKEVVARAHRLYRAKHGGKVELSFTGVFQSAMRILLRQK